MQAALSLVVGPAESIQIRQIDEPVAAPDEVVVALKATALNFMDTLIIRDRYQVKPARPFSPGAEFAGHIVTVGRDVTDFQIGDRVCAYVGHGAARERIAVKASALIRIPAQVSFDQAAAQIVTYGTVLYALRDRARISHGETLVITGASGGVGSAAIELGRLLGARLIACASGEAKLAALRAQGVNEFVDPDSGEVKQAVRALTGGTGADVVLDVTGGNLTEELIRATAWAGRYLVVGFAAGGIPKLPLNLVMLKSIDVMGIHWSAWALRDPQGHRKNTEWLLAQVAAGRLSPAIDARFPLTRIKDALGLIEHRKVKGKVLLTF
ncbi:NADPH:quinone oxidoreductase family protein [Mesorhizobium sp. M8A.F.Ca.ET.173.01.1.1]|nr:NADPH:quinone oxidoreductase family protein [Mesorhizobium sp. M8A.F.Ca.ET.173.01.1.1]